ncbi:hypothetical protein TASIC1_0001080500 [Trichoderma asperellum]|uniref:Flo11 n=1 Tax=Trichoderma asperellum TaxID=101201 RepID=A0A6V8QQB0_TRIAP|nr:hypothetical protein TASIC1_0001080500 [Trichoderma asperellum]
MAGSAVESRPTSSVGTPRDVRPRTQSISSDRPSIASHTFLALPQSISPEAAFIASSAASQIVTSNHDGHESTWYDQNGVEPSGEAAVISPAALQLVNSFLDQLLLNFLQVAKSTSLSALRPAVSDVLKPKLAKETISNADEELREYLGGSEEEEYTDPQSPHARDWDVELAWKRARLRCMVYSSLGDLEEEDEDKYMTQENLEIGEHERTSDIISPAVAIFLTSVLEYMGELTLSVAGQAASQRLRSKIERELKDGARSPAAVAERIEVEDIDMERVALDRTLGRLWRGWKKRMRAPPGEYVSSRSLSISHAGSLYDRKSSISERGTDSAEVQDDARDAVEEDIHPMNIPLPMGENDIAEIEVPGLAHYSDDEDEGDDEEEKDFDKRRVKSFAGASSLLNESQISADSEHYATLLSLHRRSTSLPTPRRSIFYATARPRSKTADAAANGIPELQELARLSVAEVEAKATPAKSRDSDESGSDEFDEVIYEKAEILTSSRVSVSSTSSRSVSDTGGADEMRKAKAIDTSSRTGVPLSAPHSGTRSSSLKAAQSATDAQFSDVPYRSGGGHSNRTKGRPTAELDEEETTPSLHSIAPPRQIHTSGSSSSSGASRFKAVRTTSDDASNRAENMARNFEELIQSNQTITYTLTPENMRDIDVKKAADSPVVTKITRKSEDLMRSSPVGSNASQSIPRAQPASPKASSENTAKLSGPIPRAPAGAYGASGRMGGPQARDARAPGESLADFAEFIKSTGPAGDRGPAALRNVQVPVNPPKTIPESQPVTAMSSRSINNRNRYQAREPAASSRNDNSDLIDFIRQGPASAAGSQNHIPRHVAPFRNPGDSEMMYGAPGGKAIDPVLPDLRHSQASTSVTDYSMPSMHSSVNSNSALIKNKSMSKANALFGEDDDDMSMPMPVRKTRRVRDPYAIDFSDEEEDDFDVAPRPPPKKEESLAEFLLNCEPPPEPPSPPMKQQPRRKSSTPGLMGRFGRNNSKEVNTLHESQSRPATMGLGNDARPSNTRKHVPIQMPPGYDAYGPIDSHPPVNKAPVERAPMNRVPMKKFEPREPAFLGQTGDLARFLRESEPPPDFNPTPVPVQQGEPSGFAKFFGRRRKASVV